LEVLSFLLLDCIHLYAHPGVENRDASLDSSASSPRIVSWRIRLWRWGGEHSVWSSSAAWLADSEEKGKRLKEKTVTPVVPGGKVEMRPKRLQDKKLRGWPLFQIEAVQFCAFGKAVLEGAGTAQFPTSPTGAWKGPV
jgi:hypothetical protein